MSGQTQQAGGTPQPPPPADQGHLHQTIQGLSDRCEKAPRHGVNGKYLIIQAARLLAQQEQAGKNSSGSRDADAPQPKQQPAAVSAKPQKPAGPAPLTAVQALALVPNAARPFVPFRPRSFCTQQQRQQVANKLLGSYLVLLLKELSVEPSQQTQVLQGQPDVVKAASAAALAHEAAVYMDVTNAKAYQSKAGAATATLQHAPQDQLQQLRVLLPSPAAAEAAATAAASQPSQPPPVPAGSKRSRHAGQADAAGAKRQRTPPAAATAAAAAADVSHDTPEMDALLDDLFEDDLQSASELEQAVSPGGKTGHLQSSCRSNPQQQQQQPPRKAGSGQHARAVSTKASHQSTATAAAAKGAAGSAGTLAPLQQQEPQADLSSQQQQAQPKQPAPPHTSVSSSAAAPTSQLAAAGEPLLDPKPIPSAALKKAVEQQQQPQQQQQEEEAAVDSEDELEREARELAALRAAREAAAAAAAAAGYVYSPTSSPNRMDDFLQQQEEEIFGACGLQQQQEQAQQQEEERAQQGAVEGPNNQDAQPAAAAAEAKSSLQHDEEQQLQQQDTSRVVALDRMTDPAVLTGSSSSAAAAAIAAADNQPVAAGDLTAGTADTQQQQTVLAAAATAAAGEVSPDPVHAAETDTAPVEFVSPEVEGCDGEGAGADAAHEQVTAAVDEQAAAADPAEAQLQAAGTEAGPSEAAADTDDAPQLQEATGIEQQPVLDPLAAEFAAAAVALSASDTYMLSEAAFAVPEDQQTAAAATTAEQTANAALEEEEEAGKANSSPQHSSDVAGDTDPAQLLSAPEQEEVQHLLHPHDAVNAVDDDGYVPSEGMQDDEAAEVATTQADAHAGVEAQALANDDAAAGDGCGSPPAQGTVSSGSEGSAGPPSPAAMGVETQVAAFVASVLEPLVKAGVVSSSLAEVVVSKAIEKIMRRHEGSTDSSFLVREYTSITKLVTALVDHYQKRGVV